MRVADMALLAFCTFLVIAGPLMALQESSRHQRDTSLAGITGEQPAPDTDFRAPWRFALLVGVVAVGILGTLAALRVATRPRVRSVVGRLLGLLLGGMMVLDVAFLADVRWLADAPYLVRAIVVAWTYPLAGILVGGAALRLAEVEQAFAPRGTEGQRSTP